MTTPRPYRKTKALFATALVCATCGAAIEYERCRSTVCQTFTSNLPRTAEGAGTVINTSGAYNGGTAVIVREFGTDSSANLVSARPEVIERYRTLSWPGLDLLDL
jgi:hypothetical protein